MELILIAVILACLALVILLSVQKRHNAPGKRITLKQDSQRHQDRLSRADRGFNPETGEWEDWDGTPYGAIDGLFTDADGEGDWDDVDSEGGL
jgi:hypothetical protein